MTPRRAKASRALALIAAAALLAVAPACRKKGGDGASDASSAEAVPITATDASEGLLLTWIDERGDFHVEQTPKDVPLVGRDAVRVVDPSRDDGTHPDRIFVADLRTALPDGTYTVRVSTKAEFDELAVQRRKGKSGVLEPTDGAVAGPSLPPTGTAPGTGHGTPSGDPSARPAVIIYGAEWCGPCHQAAAYLRSKNVPFVEKNIEADRAAGREMQEKLKKAGLYGGSIPVLDVRGKILIGFNARAVDEALGAAL